MDKSLFDFSILDNQLEKKLESYFSIRSCPGQEQAAVQLSVSETGMDFLMSWCPNVMIDSSVCSVSNSFSLSRIKQNQDTEPQIEKHRNLIKLKSCKLPPSHLVDNTP